jgi:homoserine kinase
MPRSPVSAQEGFSLSGGRCVRVRVTVPATSANLGPGFDCLALALSLRNEVEAELASEPRVAVRGEGEGEVPADERNVVYQAALQVAARAGRPDVAFAFRCRNRIPLDRGLGSSAAARVAGVVAADRLLGGVLDLQAQLDLVAQLEGHADNATAAFLGGLTVAVQDGAGRVRWQRVLPTGFPEVVVCVPEVRVPTHRARALLPERVPFSDAVFNVGRAALLVAAACAGDPQALAEAVQDRLHEPYREELVPGFRQVAAQARAAGAWAVALSGAGSSVLALVPPERAADVADAMVRAFWGEGVRSRAQRLSVEPEGVLVQEDPRGGGTWDG